MKVLLLALCLGAPAAGAGAQTTVQVEVAVAPDAALDGLEVRTRWLGEERTASLADDGVGPDREAGDGVWSGRLQGGRVLHLPVSLWVRADGGVRPAFQGIELLRGADEVLAYHLEHVDPPQARRLSSARPIAALATAEATRLGLGLLWVLGLVLAVGLLVDRRRPLGAPASAWTAWSAEKAGWAPALLWLGLAAAWTWPAVTAGGGTAVGSHFDTPGTLWSIDAAARLLPDFRDPLTAWPVGGDYRRFDSYTLAPLAALLHGLLGIDPARLHGWLQVLGVALSGWAAQRCAAGLGARAPWDLLGGVLWAMSGLAANALLEGHVYMVLDPWMPLFLLSWWRATGSRGSSRDALLAGLFFALTLLTSAYLGLSAAALAAVLLGVGLWRDRGLLRRVWPAAAVVGGVGALYVLPFLGAATAAAGHSDAKAVVMASAHLVALGLPTPEVDRATHSLGLALSGVMVALLAAAPALLARRQRWRVLALAGGLTLLLAMGPALGPGTDEAWLPLPLALLSELPVASLLRFPARLGWGALLCGAMVAALAASELERRHGRPVRLLLGLALVEAFLLVGLPLRQQTLPVAGPSVYGVGAGPVLDLFPEGLDSGGELESWFTARACLAQLSHQRPIADDCVATPVDQGPRYQLGRWLIARLLSGEGPQAGQALAALGFSAVAWHVDLFSPGDQRRLAPGLAAWDPEPLESTDGGARVVLFDLPPAGGADADQAWAARADLQAAAVGQGTGSAVRQLRIELVVPAASSEARYSVRLAAPDGLDERIELQNRGDVPDDLPGDRVWVAWIDGPMPGMLDGAVLVEQEGEEHVAWSGPIRLHGPADRLVFRESSVDPPVFRPIAAAPHGRFPPGNRSSGPVAAVGWGLVLAAGLALGLRRAWRRPRIGPVASVALVLLAALPARAQDTTPTPASLPVGPVEGAALVVHDGLGKLGPSPTARIGEVVVALVDDGQGADLLAGDGVWTGTAPLPEGGMLALELVRTDGTTIWSDSLPLNPGGGLPVVKLVLTATRPLVGLSTVGGSADPPPPPAEEGGGITPPPPPEGEEEAIRVTVAPPAPGGAFTGPALAVQAVVGLLGLVAGAWLGLRRGRPLQPALQPLGPPPAPGAVACYRVPAALRRALLLDLARQAPGAVVLAPAGPLSDPLPAGCVRLAGERPEPAELRAAAALAATLGPVRLLVEGSAAVAAPGSDEEADAPLRELLGQVQPGVEALVLLVEGEAGPALELRREGAALVGEVGPVLVEGPGGWALAAQARA